MAIGPLHAGTMMWVRIKKRLWRGIPERVAGGIV